MLLILKSFFLKRLSSVNFFEISSNKLKLKKKMKYPLLSILLIKILYRPL